MASIWNLQFFICTVMAAFVDDDFDFTVLKLRPIFIFYISIRSFFWWFLWFFYYLLAIQGICWWFGYKYWKLIWGQGWGWEEISNDLEAAKSIFSISNCVSWTFLLFLPKRRGIFFFDLISFLDERLKCLAYIIWWKNLLFVGILKNFHSGTNFTFSFLERESTQVWRSVASIPWWRLQPKQAYSDIFQRSRLLSKFNFLWYEGCR